jgi:hypothetical protein
MRPLKQMDPFFAPPRGSKRGTPGMPERAAKSGEGCQNFFPEYQSPRWRSLILGQSGEFYGGIMDHETLPNWLGMSTDTPVLPATINFPTHWPHAGASSLLQDQHNDIQQRLNDMRSRLEELQDDITMYRHILDGDPKDHEASAGLIASTTERNELREHMEALQAVGLPEPPKRPALRTADKQWHPSPDIELAVSFEYHTLTRPSMTPDLAWRPTWETTTATHTVACVGIDQHEPLDSAKQRLQVVMKAYPMSPEAQGVYAVVTHNYRYTAALRQAGFAVIVLPA